MHTTTISTTKSTSASKFFKLMKNDLMTLTLSISTAGAMLFAMGGEVLANNWKLPFQGTATVNQTSHPDDYNMRAIDLKLSIGSDVLAPVDAKVISQCNAGNNHRAMLLESVDGVRFSLIHVTTSDIYNGKTYKQGDVIGKVASDTPKNACAYSTGVHLHFGLSSNISVDGRNILNLPLNASLTSSNIANGQVFVLWSSSIPLKAYAGAGTSFRVTRDVATNSPLYFSARANGEGVIDSFRRSSQPNTLWYKLNGVNEWMSAAQVLDLRTVAVFVLWSPSSPLKAYAGPGTNFPVTRNVAASSPLYFSAWAYGEPLPSQSGSDARWYKLNGINEWIPGAHVIGIAPGTTPMP